MIDETVEEILDMQTHSSSTVAIKAATALETLADRDVATVEEFERDLERNASALRRANPSHATLQTALTDIVETVTGDDHATVEDAKAAARTAILDVVEEIEQAKGRAAANALPLLEDGATILTHDYSTTVLEAIERAAGEGRSLDVYVTEARPRFLGRRTARTLADIDGVESHLLTDAAAGFYLADCDHVFLGITCIVEDVLYNRVGTFPLAATAAYVGTPVSVVGAESKIVGTGFVFENEHRAASEVMREPSEGFSIANPAYDATPIELLDRVVTEEGRQDV